jgi:hypothetical protein
MEPFEIITRNGDKFEVRPTNYMGKINYLVNVGEYEVTYTGNPEIGGAFLIPENAPKELDLILLEDIAAAIESRLL